MMRYIRGLPQMHIIMVSYYGTHKGNRRLQGQAMSHGIIDIGVDAAREIYERGICLEEYFEQ